MISSDKHRKSIRQTSKRASNNRISPQWKDALKQKCLERAREKRDQRIALHRQSSPIQQYMNFSEFDFDGNANCVENNCDECTRSIIENQLQATGITVISSSQNDDRAVHFCTPIRGGKFDDEDAIMCRPSLFPEIGIHDGTYITEEELFSLMNEIEEEIHRDEEQYWAEQMELLQHEEEMNELLLEEQIESFENLHIDNDHSIPCPLCHSGMLLLGTTTQKISCSSSRTTTNDTSGIIYCKRNKQHQEREENICKLSQGAYFGHEMTLECLKQILINAYEEHSTLCKGELKFDFLESHDQCGLVATCTHCSKRNMLVPTSPIQR